MVHVTRVWQSVALAIPLPDKPYQKISLKFYEVILLEFSVLLICIITLTTLYEITSSLSRKRGAYACEHQFFLA